MEPVFNKDPFGKFETYGLKRINNLTEFQLAHQTHEHPGIVKRDLYKISQ